MVREAVRLKKEAFQDTLSRPLRQSQRTDRLEGLQLQQRVWEKFGDAMENDFRNSLDRLTECEAAGMRMYLFGIL